ncbi:hypothetical protein S83_004726, partial [Arachis hypogaea]
PATKRKRGSTKCLKTHGLSYEDRLPIRLNKYGQPIGCNRAKLSSHLGTLEKFDIGAKAKGWAMKNPDRREPSQSEPEDVIVSHPEKLESTNQDDILSQVLGKDQPGRVRTYGRGVVASDLWGPRSQVETKRLIEEVKENAQTEIQNIQQKMQKEMEIKIQERVEDMKSQILCGFNEVEATATTNHDVFAAEKEISSKSSTITEGVFKSHTKSLLQIRKKNVILSPKKKQ